MFVIRNGRKPTAYIYGPFASKDDAQQWLAEVRTIAGQGRRVPDLREPVWEVIELWEPIALDAKAA